MVRRVNLEVGNPTTLERWETFDCLVDSGAIYSVIRPAVLNRIGVAVTGQQEFRPADGSRVVRRRGIAAFRLGEVTGGADVIFGEEGDSNLLGAFTLEALGLGLDPLKRELFKLPMVMW